MAGLFSNLLRYSEYIITKCLSSISSGVSRFTFPVSCIFYTIYMYIVFFIKYLLPCIFFYLSNFILFLYPAICILCDGVHSLVFAVLFILYQYILVSITFFLYPDYVKCLYLVYFILYDLNWVSCICITSTCINSCIHSLHSFLCHVQLSCTLCCVQCILENA